MASMTPDWSALASQNERLADEREAEGLPVPASRPRRRLAARRGAAVAAAALAVTGAMSASAQAAVAVAPLRWHTVLSRNAGPTGNFTAVVAIGKTSGWAFNAAGPSAWRRNGTKWTKIDFPGKPGERVVAAGASSATDVWAFTAGAARSRVLRWNGSTWSRVHSFSKQVGGALVLSRTNVWVFGAPAAKGQRLGAWHFDGQNWTHPASGLGLEGGSASSATNIWAFNGTNVYRWNGGTSSWTATSVAAQLPAKVALNNPGVTAMYAQSATSVWAIGNGNLQDEGGPLVVLHFDGHTWKRVATATSARFPGFGSLGQVAPDGNGGLWIPMPGSGSQPGHLVHFSGGKLTGATLPAAANMINVVSIKRIPGTAQELAGGFTHAAGKPGTNVVAVVLQLKR
jgi:hypothetical protein